MYLIALIPLGVAYALYQGLAFTLPRIGRGEFYKEILKKIRKPSFFLFLEVGALISLKIGHFPFIPLLTHAVLVFLIFTLGWCLVSLTTAIYHHYLLKYQSAGLGDFSERSFLTQAQMLYRLGVFVISCLTLAAILLTFPQMKSFGIGILGSAGVAGLALGLAAKPLLGNLIAGFQIAFTKIIKIGDIVVVDGEQGRVEQISLTHVILRIWDYRRKIVPIGEFIGKPFENWSEESTELIGTVFFYCDYRTSLEELRKGVKELLEKNSLWNKKWWQVDVVDLTEVSMKVRVAMTADTPSAASDLQNYMRERVMMLATLPRQRYDTISS